MTIIRAFTATPAGILPQHVAGFVVAEVIGAAVAIAAGRYFWPKPNPAAAPEARPRRIPA
jgi:membrane protein DedA with SNARE-associated domain